MKNIRVGILTFHEADNYGATLQAYALQKVISKKANCEIINYHCKFILDQIKRVNTVSFPRKLFASIFKTNKHIAFKRFDRKHLKLSRDYNEMSKTEMNGSYDLVFVGSDQVWNIECTGNDKTYFADSINDDTPLLSYVASFGAGPYPQDCESYFQRFSTISLREDKYFEKLKKLCPEVRKDIDPTMLLDKEEWSELSRRKPMSAKYVFVYLIGEQIHLLESAEKYAVENNCKVITNKSSLSFFLHCSPEDFIDWIYYAECVFTNSFHGTVFSILFHKKFAVECSIRGGYNNRAKNLLDLVGLENAQIENWNGTESIDWTIVDKTIESLQARSKQFIYESIKAVSAMRNDD